MTCSEIQCLGVKWSGTLGLAVTKDRMTALRRQQAVARYIAFITILINIQTGVAKLIVNNLFNVALD